METKICTKCNIEKDVECFSKNKNTKDGLKNYCKECDALYIKSLNYKPLEIDYKTCSKCKKEKLITEFSTNKITKDGYYAWCKECRTEYNRDYIKKKPKKYILKDRKYISKDGKYDSEYFRNAYIKNTLRILVNARICFARKKNLPYDSQEDLINYLKPIFDKRKCEICDRDLESSIGYHAYCSPSIDRIVPRFGYVVGNVAILCWECNKIKNNATPEKLFEIAEWCKERLEDDFFKLKNNQIE